MNTCSSASWIRIVQLNTSTQWLVEKSHQLTAALFCAAIGASWVSHGLDLYREITSQPPEKTYSATQAHKPYVSTTDLPLLFGEIEEDTSALQARNIPATTLNLKLRGVLAGDTHSSAIIEDASGQSQLYNIGDSLAEGITLLSVHEDSVVINYKDRLQRILFPEEETGAPATTGPSSHTTPIPAAWPH